MSPQKPFQSPTSAEPVETREETTIRVLPALLPAGVGRGFEKERWVLDLLFAEPMAPNRQLSCR